VGSGRESTCCAPEGSSRVFDKLFDGLGLNQKVQTGAIRFIGNQCDRALEKADQARVSDLGEIHVRPGARADHVAAVADVKVKHGGARAGVYGMVGLPVIGPQMTKTRFGFELAEGYVAITREQRFGPLVRPPKTGSAPLKDVFELSLDAVSFLPS